MKDFKILDKMVDDWHYSDSKLTLKEYLGLTDEEFQRYIDGDEPSSSTITISNT